MQFIDIHNHLAWNIDDGMENMEQAKISLENARTDGIKAIIATPHFIPGKQDKEDLLLMTKRMKELKELAKQFDIEIYFGSEIFLNDDYLDMIDKDNFYTLAGSGYALCEFDVRQDIMKLGDMPNDRLYEFTVRDMIPVIAHVERYFPKGISLDMVKEWFDSGYIIQVNRTSLLGHHGEMIKKNAWKLLQEGLVHVIATDTHRAKGHRVCQLSDVYAMVSKEVGKENAELLFYYNPLHIIQNEELEEMKVIKKKKTIFQFFKR